MSAIACLLVCAVPQLLLDSVPTLFDSTLPLPNAIRDPITVKPVPFLSKAKIHRNVKATGDPKRRRQDFQDKNRFTVTELQIDLTGDLLRRTFQTRILHRTAGRKRRDGHAACK